MGEGGGGVFDSKYNILKSPVTIQTTPAFVKMFLIEMCAAEIFRPKCSRSKCPRPATSVHRPLLVMFKTEPASNQRVTSVSSGVQPRTSPCWRDRCFISLSYLSDWLVCQMCVMCIAVIAPICHALFVSLGLL